jgi:hypothetical protein
LQPGTYRALEKTNFAVWPTSDTVIPFAQSYQIASLVPQLRLTPLADKPHAVTFGDASTLLVLALPFRKLRNQDPAHPDGMASSAFNFSGRALRRPLLKTG